MIRNKVLAETKIKIVFDKKRLEHLQDFRSLECLQQLGYKLMRNSNVKKRTGEKNADNTGSLQMTK